MAQQHGNTDAAQPRGGLFGSLKDALNAAGRAEPGGAARPAEAVAEAAEPIALPPPTPQHPQAHASSQGGFQASAHPGHPGAADNGAVRTRGVSAHEAARAVRGAAAGPGGFSPAVEPELPPTTRVVKAGAAHVPPAKTELVRGRQQVTRGTFEQDPVVGWLVVVGGPGIGSYRPIFEGNNTVGRSPTQRIALDFGDEAISSEEQAYIRYDSTDRSFLFVPNLAKTNVVSLNDRRPTGAVELRQMDVIVIGRTQLVFVPFCGADFDWSELADAKV